MLDGADGITWADADLTELGEGQAKDVNELWKSSLPKGIPVPETYYVSPLRRTIQTADLTFKDFDLPDDEPYTSIGKEVSCHILDVLGKRANIHSSSANASGYTRVTAVAQPRKSAASSLT